MHITEAVWSLCANHDTRRCTYTKNVCRCMQSSENVCDRCMQRRISTQMHAWFIQKRTNTRTHQGATQHQIWQDMHSYSKNCIHIQGRVSFNIIYDKTRIHIQKTAFMFISCIYFVLFVSYARAHTPCIRAHVFQEPAQVHDKHSSAVCANTNKHSLCVHPKATPASPCIISRLLSHTHTYTALITYTYTHWPPTCTTGGTRECNSAEQSCARTHKARELWPGKGWCRQVGLYRWDIRQRILS